MVIGLRHTIKQIVKKITINNTLEDLSKIKLSIQFSLDGFSFCISNANNEISHFSSYEFSKNIKTPKLILEKLKDIFIQEKSLQEDFESVSVIHQNNLNTIVPNQYFRDDELKHYLKYSIKTIATDLIVYDDLESIDSKNVYIPYVNINNFLFQNFGEFEYRHHSSVLLKKLFATSHSNLKFYINVSKSMFDIIVIKESKLIFYNTFEYDTKEDFIYYILFTLEQLELSPQKTMITLIGAIDNISDSYRILYTYVRNINFHQSNNPIFNTQNKLPKHSNYILLG